MKSRLLTISLAAAAFTVALPGSAQKVDAFPGMFVPEETNAQRVMQRAPLNKDKRLGTKVFGPAYIDYNRKRSFVHYYENSYELERVGPIFFDSTDNPDFPALYAVFAGAYNPDDGYYYAYKVKAYDLGITSAYQWLKVDPKSGESEIIATLDAHMHDRTFLYDMAYSIYDGEMYGLVQNDDGQVKSRIGLVDMTNSKVDDLVQLPEYYFAMAFDYEGNLFAVRWDYDKDGIVIGTRLDSFDKDWKVIKSQEIKVNGEAYKSYYQHGLDFDYSTGDLIWAATDNQGKQRMVRINPDNGQTTLYGNVGINECMIGIYVPYTTADHREAPAMVKDMSFTIDPQGQNNVTLTWTNPTTRWNRQPLNDLTSVVIYRDAHSGTPIGTVDATGKEGQQMSFTDKGATQGIHKYYIMGVNAKGEGVEAHVEAFVGRDVPGQVNDLTVKAINNARGVEVTWTAPTVGDSEGWFDKTITYDIERLPDNKKLATGLTEMKYEDKDIPEAQYYSYVITPVTSDGRGTPRTSDGVLAGGSLKVPFSTDFSSAPEAARFTSFDQFGVSNLFEYAPNNITPGTMVMRYFYNKSTNATLSSPRMNLTKGKKYRVDWHVTLGRYGHTFEDTYNHFRILGGTEPTYEAMNGNVLAEYKDFLSEKINESFVITHYFESPVDGDYCVGFNVATNDQARKEDWIYITEFSVSESPDNDLAVNSMVLPMLVSSNNDNAFDVEVYNNGANTQSKYKVEVGVSRLDGVFVPFASTEDVPAIEAYKTATVRVMGKPAVQGVQDLAARVVLEGDGAASNDMSELYTVDIADGPAYNHHIVDKATEWTATTLPINVYYTKSMSQSIYTTDMLGLTEEANKIAGLAWEYNSEIDVDNVKLQVYLSTTADDAYNANRAKMIADGHTLVYDGSVSLKAGDNQWMAISFPEKVYTLAKDKNLVVTIFAEESACNGTFPLFFHVFNSGSASPDADKFVHTLVARSEIDFSELATTPVYSYKEIPVLHIAMEGDTGVESIFAAGNNMAVRVAGNVAYFSSDVTNAAVYDMNGRMLRSFDVKNRNSVSLNLGKGIYMLKARNAEGVCKVVKFIVG